MGRGVWPLWVPGSTCDSCQGSDKYSVHFAWSDPGGCRGCGVLGGGRLLRPSLGLPHGQNYWKRKSNFRIHPGRHQNERPEGGEAACGALVRPQLGYSAPVWDPSSRDKGLQLEGVQRGAARWATGGCGAGSGVVAVLGLLGWGALGRGRADARLCLFYRVVYGLVAVPLPNYIQPTHRISRYCHSVTYRQVQASTPYYKYSFFPLAIVQWNALPEAVAGLPDLDLFRVAVSGLQRTGPWIRALLFLT